MYNKFTKIFLTLLIFIITYYILAIFIIVITKNKYMPTENSKIDAIIILGSQVLEDKTPSYNLKSRLDLFLNYNYLDVPVIVSGAQGSDEPISEASCMRLYLELKGVDSKLIYEENMATSTYENLLYSKEIIKDIDQDIQNVLIITNKFHIYRTSFLAKRLDYNFYIAGANTNNKIKNIIREPLAIVKSFIFDR